VMSIVQIDSRYQRIDLKAKIYNSVFIIFYSG
jgi:hypothetical protein